jgi:hypothetical protein
MLQSHACHIATCQRLWQASIQLRTGCEAYEFVCSGAWRSVLQPPRCPGTASRRHGNATRSSELWTLQPLRLSSLAMSPSFRKTRLLMHRSVLRRCALASAQNMSQYACERCSQVSIVRTAVQILHLNSLHTLTEMGSGTSELELESDLHFEVNST